MIFSIPLDGLQKNEQLFVRGRVVGDGNDVGYDARLSARLFLADEDKHVEPKGHVEQVASWKGNLSKENGSNCLAGQGPSGVDKFGVARLKRDAGRRLFVTLAATSSAPFLSNRTPGDRLPIKSGSFLKVVRYKPEMFG